MASYPERSKGSMAWDDVERDDMDSSLRQNDKLLLQQVYPAFGLEAGLLAPRGMRCAAVNPRG
jgi:hypothetical protein